MANLDDIDLNNIDPSGNLMELFSDLNDTSALSASTEEIQKIVSSLHSDIDTDTSFNIDLDELLSGADSEDFVNTEAVDLTADEIDSITAKVLGTSHPLSNSSTAPDTNSQNTPTLSRSSSFPNLTAKPLTKSTNSVSKPTQGLPLVTSPLFTSTQSPSSAPVSRTSSPKITNVKLPSNSEVNTQLSARTAKDDQKPMLQRSISDISKTGPGTSPVSRPFLPSDSASHKVSVGRSSTPLLSKPSNLAASLNTAREQLLSRASVSGHPNAVGVMTPNNRSPMLASRPSVTNGRLSHLPSTPTPIRAASNVDKRVPVSNQLGSPSSRRASGNTLLDTILSQLQPDKQEKLKEIFKNLQENLLSPELFLAKARELLGAQHSPLLANLRARSSTTPASPRLAQTPQPVNLRSSPNTPALSAYTLLRKRLAEQTNAAAGSTPNASNKKFKVAHTPGVSVTSTPLPSTSLPAGIGSYRPPGVAPVVTLSQPQAQTPSRASPTLPPALVRPPGVTTLSKPSTPAQTPPIKDNKVDFDTLTDVMGYVGVDLKEESDNIMRQSEIMDKSRGVDVIDQSKTQDFLSLRVLKSMVDKIAKPYHIPNVDPDFLVYLALATQDRLKSLVEQMILASKHRVRSHHLAPPPMVDNTDVPLYKIVVSEDVKKQLLSLERVNREDECKRKRLLAEREKRLAEESTKGENKEESGDTQKTKKTRRKDGLDLPGAARNMNDANTTALLIAGGVRRSWMLAEPNGTSVKSMVLSSPGSIKAGTNNTKLGKSVSNTSASGASVSASPNNLSNPQFNPVPKPVVHSSKASIKSGGRSHGHPVTPGSKSRLILPPSTVNHPSTTNAQTNPRKVTVRDALFSLEKDTNLGNGERVLLKGYVKWLK